MTDLASAAPLVPPLALAGLVLAALPILEAHDLPRPIAAAVIEALGVSKSRAYEVRAQVLQLLPTLVRRSGRPVSPRAPPIVDERLAALTGRALDFLVDHPGAVHRQHSRSRYSDGFRLFAVQSAADLADLDLDLVADALHVPASTLRSWMADDRVDVDPPEKTNAAASALAALSAVEAVLAAWDLWKGDFVPFCTHVQLNLRIPLGRAAIAAILEAEGVRLPRRRPGRDKDADALRKQFQTFFPGAQWVGDGTEISVTVEDERYTFNLEVDVDAASGALVGVSLRDTEDAQAVVEAFRDGVVTTGAAPQALLLDNKPSNHASEVVDALGKTLKIRATPHRPENKAHVEGTFGLFAQEAPPLVVPSTAPADVARTVALLVFIAWARAVNHRPRLDGRGSRVNLYRASAPTPEEVAAARLALEERYRRQEEARKTRQARLDPVAKATIGESFARFAFDDPEGHLAAAIGRYPLEAIVEGVAIFSARQRSGTLPDGVDARYLLGIVRRIAEENELIVLIEELWRGRLAARDRHFARLDEQREAVAADPTASDHIEELVVRYVDLALAAPRRIDRFFWLNAAVDAILEVEWEAEPVRHLFRLASRRISATHALPRPERALAIRFLAAKLAPIHE